MVTMSVLPFSSAFCDWSFLSISALWWYPDIRCGTCFHFVVAFWTTCCKPYGVLCLHSLSNNSILISLRIFFFYPSIIFVRERINSSFILNVRPLLICLILLNGPYCEHHPWFFTSNQVCPRGLRVGQDIVRVLSRFYLFPCLPTEIWNLHKSHYIKLHFSITNESFLCYGA